MTRNPATFGRGKDRKDRKDTPSERFARAHEGGEQAPVADNAEAVSALAIVRDIAGWTFGKRDAAAIADAVGSDPADLARWRDVVAAYRERYSGPHLQAMLDWFARGVPEAGRGNRNGASAPAPARKPPENLTWEGSIDLSTPEGIAAARRGLGLPSAQDTAKSGQKRLSLGDEALKPIEGAGFDPNPAKSPGRGLPGDSEVSGP